jgi:hypothetical protein
LQNNLERNEKETKNTLGKQIETLDREKTFLKKRLETEDRQHSAMTKHWEVSVTIIHVIQNSANVVFPC